MSYRDKKRVMEKLRDFHKAVKKQREDRLRATYHRPELRQRVQFQLPALLHTGAAGGEHKEASAYEVSYADEDEPLGTGGGLYLLKNKINRTFILPNCDILIRDDFGKMLASHKKHKNMITMVSSLKSYPIPYGVVHLGEDGNLESIEEKPQMSFLTNTGVYIIEPEVLDMIPENTFMGFPNIIEKVQAEGHRVGIYPVSEHA